MTAPDAVAALRATAAAGPFFRVDPWTAGTGWRPLSELATHPVIGERVAAARAAIGERAGLPPASVELRVATSIVFLGLSARLVSPPLGAAVLTGVVPALSLGALWWRPVSGAPWPIAVTPVPGVDAGSDAAGVLMRQVVTGVIAPVLDAFAAYGALSRKVLWGNVASAIGGALGMLAVARPDRAEHAATVTDSLLRTGPLRGTGELVQPDPADPRRFLVRSSCCLYYRVPGGGTCGDCVLTPHAVRRQQWQSALER